MDAAHYDCLLHTFKGHTKHEKPSDFEVTRQVDEDLTEGCDLASLL